MPTIPTFKATRFIRRLRGQTRAQLIVAEDGLQYVVKYSNNPVGRRVLVNELISSLTLNNLDIRIPSMAFIWIDEEVLQRAPEIGVASDGNIAPPPHGLHFGCRYAGTDSKTVYDFIPDQMLSQVTNRNDFLGTLV
ncbi:MAG TPA: HipA family kinase, partial [Bryobacteraceae bacterium]